MSIVASRAVARYESTVTHARRLHPPRHVEGVGAGLFLIAVTVSRDEQAALELRLADAASPIASRAEHTAYARDPEGNRVAISCYPLA